MLIYATDLIYRRVPSIVHITQISNLTALAGSGKNAQSIRAIQDLIEKYGVTIDRKHSTGRN